MTDEEMADKHAKEYVKHWIVSEDDNALMQDAYKDGFLDGLKAGRLQWHDLRKDPTDLPLGLELVLCACKNGNYVLRYFSETSFISSNVIAWCEIPTFDKE